MEGAGAPIPYQGGRAAQIVFRDITSRKLSEEALRASEERFRTLIEQAADAYFVSEQNGRLVDVNAKACASLGYTREELLTMEMADINVGLTPNMLAETWDKLTQSGPQQGSRIQRRKDGTTFPVEVRVSRIEFGGTHYRFTAARDISGRLEAELAVQASEEKFRALVEHAADAFYLFDETGQIVDVNQQACAALGYTREELLSLPPGAFNPDDSAEQRQEVWHSVFPTGIAAGEGRAPAQGRDDLIG